MTGNARVILGKRYDDYGLYVSKPGYDARFDDDGNMLFHMNGKIMQVLAQGSVSYASNATGLTVVPITNTANATPIAAVYELIKVASGNQATFNTGYLANVIVNSSAISFNVSNSIPYATEFSYFVFAANASDSVSAPSIVKNEYRYLEHPENKRLIGPDSALYAERIAYTGNTTTDGGTEKNNIWYLQKLANVANTTEDLNIEGQRICYETALGGLVSNNVNSLERAIAAIKWGFKPDIRGSNYNWPDNRDGIASNVVPGSQETIHGVSVFLNRVGQTIYMLDNDPRTPSGIRAELPALKANYVLAANSLNSASGTASFLSSKVSMNQRFSLALSLYFGGMWANGAAATGMKARGASIFDFAANVQNTPGPSPGDPGTSNCTNRAANVVIGRAFADGTLPEGPCGGSYDFGYQTVSIDSLTQYLSFYLNDGLPTPAPVLNLLKKATTRVSNSINLTQVDNAIALTENGVNATAVIAATGVLELGSRTAVEEFVIGNDPKGDAIDQMAVRLRYANQIVQDPQLYVIANAVFQLGIKSDHIDDAVVVVDGGS